MAREVGVRPFLANLTRRGAEVQSQDDFRELLTQGFRDAFVPLAWEDLYTLSGLHRKEMAKLRAYLENKTASLRQAFDLGRTW